MNEINQFSNIKLDLFTINFFREKENREIEEKEMKKKKEEKKILKIFCSWEKHNGKKNDSTECQRKRRKKN